MPNDEMKKTLGSVQTDSTEFDTKLDLYKHILAVKSSVKKNISSDYVLAFLPEKEKEYVISMTCNAHLGKRTVLRCAIPLEMELVKPNLTKSEKEILKRRIETVEKIADQTFDVYMTEIHMIVNLNRNVPKNHLVNVLTKTEEEEEEKDPTTEAKEEIMKKLGENREKVA